MILLICIIVGGIVLDQISKLLVVEFLKPVGTLPLIPDIFHFTYLENDGAALGMLSEHRWIFMVISSVAIPAIGVYLFRFCRESLLFRSALAMIVSGGIGNMIDRIRLGYVVDFIDFRAFSFWKWIFNIADSLVVVGCILIFLSMILDEIKAKRKKKEEATDADCNG